VKDYFVIWRFFPKLSIGALFIFEVLGLLLGGRTSSLSRSIFVGLATYFTGPTLLVSIIILLAIVANLGVWILNLLCGILGGGLRSLSRRWLFSANNKDSSLRDLVEPCTEIAFRFYRNDPSFYSEWFRLRNLATSELNKRKPMENFTREINEHILSLRRWDEIEAINYYTSLSQDQARVDKLTDDTQTLWNVLITVLMLPSIARMLEMTPATGITVSAVSLVLALSLVPQIIRRKRYVAAIIIIGYMDIFSFGPTSIEEREGETLL
jgi:hypothetical protein